MAVEGRADQNGRAESESSIGILFSIQCFQMLIFLHNEEDIKTLGDEL